MESVLIQEKLWKYAAGEPEKLRARFRERLNKF
jgi:hypothetical protein